MKKNASAQDSKFSFVIKEQKQHLKRLDKLMVDKDTIDLCYLQVFLVGPPGVGKTTTLNRLLHIIDNLCSAGDEVICRSTLLANCIQVLAFISDDAAEWLSSEDADEETKLVFGLLKERLSEVLSRAVQEDTTGASLVPSIEGASRPWLSKMLSRIRKKRQTKPTKPQSVAGPESASEFPSLTTHTQQQVVEKQRTTEVKARLQNLIKTGDYSKMARMVGNTLLNINDIGGQPGFLEMLPALSAGPAMYLVFLDLSKDLDKPYKIPFSRDTTITTPFDAIHTVESTISQILSAIASAHSAPRVASAYSSAAAFNRKFEQFQQISPVAVLVGTHKDKLDDPDLRIKQADQVLKKTVQKFSSVLVTPPHSNTAFFPVDNYNGTEQSDIGPIRRFMNDVFSTHFKDASLPICPKWLIFGTIIRREYKIVKVDDCIELGGILEMDGEEIKFCIWYLDCIGTLMHYPNIANDEDGWFKNHVICSPQVIFDSTSQLIVASLRTLHSEGHVIEHERLELIKKGQFSIESIEKYCFSDEVTEKLKRDELIPASKLVKLLEHVNLLSPITHKEADGERITYLMPAVLDCATQDELAAPHTPDTSHPEPLLITFKCGYVPTGTFCGLITQLVSRGPHGISDFKWDLVEDGVKRNYVSFYVDYVSKVTLICHDRCYEVRVVSDDPDISLHELCDHILSALLHILKELYEKLNPEIAFRCPCPKHRADRSINNLCALLDTKRQRFLCDKQPVKLEENQRVWIGEHLKEFLSEGTRKFGASHQLTKQEQRPVQGELNLKEAKKIANDARFKWFDIGIELDIDLDILADIRTRNHYVVDDCFTEMLSHWLSRPFPPPTWSALAKALTSPVIGRQDIAGTIKLEPESDSDQSMQETGGFSLKEVRRITWEVRSEWRNLGSQLGVDAGTLDALQSTKHHVVDDCFTEMLSHWLKRSTSPPTWTELKDALKSPVIGRHDIAGNVEDKWGKQK